MRDGCSKSHLEMVDLIRFRTVSDELLYMTGKRMKFLIDVTRLNLPEIPDRYLLARGDSIFRGYGEFHL